ncbi:MAG: peptidase [Polyangiaceae bacterium]|nr:peptidase [Polyangiaceae bacterium]
MKRHVRFLPLTLALLAGSYAHAKELPNFDAYQSAKASTTTPRKGAAKSVAGFASSVDEKRGAPTFFWSVKGGQTKPAALSTARPADLAQHYLRANAAAYGLSPAAIQTAVVDHIHDTGRGGIIVIFRQRIDGADVMHSDLKVLMNRQGDLVAIGGNLHPAATPKGKGKARSFKVSPSQAIANAFNDLYGVKIAAAGIVDAKKEKGDYRYFKLAPTPAVKAAKITFTKDARARKVFFPMPDSIVPAYYLEIQAGKLGSANSDVYGYVVAANDGRLLMRRNLTHDATYRVWADAAFPYTPLDGPHEDFTPHPTGTPDNSTPAFIAPITVTTDGFNKNPNGMADPWLPAGGTETVGNNVDAYTDHTGHFSLNTDGFTAGVDFRATMTGADTFDRTFNTSAHPQATQDQSMAAVTQLFYVNNWLHDWWYDSGFNESAGNAQLSNFGRGGEEGDPLHVEAQDAADFGTRDNANMSTPADGESPRMQMYLWTSEMQGPSSLVVNPLGLTAQVGTASFGKPFINTTAEIVLVNDGNGTTTDACQAVTNNVAGKIALVDRGNCSFQLKGEMVQNAGAVGMIVINNQPMGLPPNPMGGDPAVGPVFIGTLGIAKPDGDAIKAALLNAAQTGIMARDPGVERDGTIDNSIVAHEWGHYIHHRLVNCGMLQCGGHSEGWGDFNALLMAMRDGDNFDTGTFAAAIYSTAAFGDEGYFGIRRFPYSRDMNVNGLTFKHITDGEPLPVAPMQDWAPDNFETHNAGEVWAQMLFDAYTNLILNGGHTFDVAKRRMTDYLAGGMMMAPSHPTFNEQRDGILAAAAAADENDLLLLAQGFARRGAGTCAVSPPRDSTDGSGVVEDFMLRGRHEFVSLTIDDSIKSCDGDGVLDNDEVGNVTLTVINQGIDPLVGTQVSLTTATPGVTFPNGATATLPDMKGFETVTVAIPIALDGSVSPIIQIDLDAAITNAGSCTATINASDSKFANFDDILASTTLDKVDTDVSAFTRTGELADDVWSRELEAGTMNHYWRAVDFDSHSDTSLESPDLMVSANQNLVISFDHIHDYEVGPETPGGPDVYWDGSLLEVSEDGGMTWNDISQYIAAPYNGTIANIMGADNPLGDRPGFVGTNPSFPNWDNVQLDFGNAFAGKTIKFRFRIGSDAAAGAPGWQIDNISVQGITNTPFNDRIVDDKVCNTAPTANAGPDQSVNANDAVTLDASASSDPENDPLTFAWAQTNGPAVVLTDGTTANAKFTAPAFAMDTVLTFEVTVSDGVQSATDTVDILVKADSGMGGAGGGMGGAGGGMGGNGMGGSGMGGMGGSVDTGGAGGTGGTRPGPDEEGGCGCSVVGEDSSPASTSSIASLLAMAALLFRRRRNGDRSRS